MKELDAFFDKVDEIIDETYRLNNFPKTSYFGKFTKMFYNNPITVVKWIVKYSLEMKYADNEEKCLSKQRSLNAQLYNYKYPIGDRCKDMLIRYIFSSSCSLETKICKEAMKELKVIASNLFYSASIDTPELLQKKLFEMPCVDRIAFAKLTARETDGHVSAIYFNIKSLEDNGWDSTYIKRDISTCILHIFREFALFNIDLTPIIKQGSDYEKEFGTYDYFRDEQFNSNNCVQEVNFQYDNIIGDLNETSKGDEYLEDKKIWVLGDDKKKKRTLKTLHELIGDGKAAHASKILKAAIKASAIIKPTFTQIKREFPNIGNESGFNNQMLRTHSDEDISPLMVFFS